MKFTKSILLFVILSGGIFITMYLAFALIKYKDVPLLNRTNTFYSVKGNMIYDRFHEFDENEDWDVIIFGSSHAYRAYDPKIFEEEGLKTYNLGSGAQSIVDTYHIINNIKVLPELLIIDLFSGSFELDRIESASKLIPNVKSPELAKEIAFSDYKWQLTNCYALRLLNKHESPVYIESESSDVYYRGYVSCPDSIKTEMDYSNLGEEFEPNELSQEYFQKLLNLLVERSAKVVFTSQPLPKPIQNTEMEEMEKYIRKTIDGRFYYWNMSIDLSDKFHPSNHFFDESHLNEAGVKIYNQFLIKNLWETGFIE
ncbi:hypothetical protein JYT21_00235 [bacterium AH-315-B15]|nr:hypothetical protein [bacterium AH-315-B15]